MGQYVNMTFLPALIGLSLVVVPAIAHSQACCSPSGGSASFGTAEQTNLGSRQLKVAVFWEYFDQDRTLTAGNGVVAPLQPRTETIVTSLLMSYGLSGRISLETVVPLVSRERRFVSSGVGGDLGGIGLGDLSVAARYLLWYDSPLVLKAVGIRAGVRVPTGQDNVADDGVTLPETLQPGTGAYGYFVGPSVFFNFHPVSVFATGQYDHLFESDSGYQYGDRLDLSAGGSYAFSRVVEVFLGGRFLHAEPNEVNGIADLFSGEQRFYLFPGVTLQPFGSPLSLQALTNLPLYESVDGLGSGLGLNLVVNASYTFTP